MADAIKKPIVPPYDPPVARPIISYLGGFSPDLAAAVLSILGNDPLLEVTQAQVDSAVTTFRSITLG